jgi:hypothetical protein
VWGTLIYRLLSLKGIVVNINLKLVSIDGVIPDGGNVFLSIAYAIVLHLYLYPPQYSTFTPLVASI